jgi:lysyl-tRNA synthetase class 1
VQWQEDKLLQVISELGLDFDKETISQRLPLAKNWLVKYNPEELIVLNEEINTEYLKTLSEEQKTLVKKLHAELANKQDASISDLEFLAYQIPKDPNLTEEELKKAQRAFFKDIYNLLISKDTGPRLGTFLWAADRANVLKLLDI